jgi:hydrogenase maturation protease HycI
MIRASRVRRISSRWNLLDDEVRNVFVGRENDGFLIITIGNQFRADDGAGVLVGNNIRKLPHNYRLINAEDRPENTIEEAISVKPTITIIIDAADFGGRVGEMRLLPVQSIREKTLSTHAFPLDVFAKIIEKETMSKIIFIGIQIHHVTYDENMSDEVKKSAIALAEYINSLNGV